MKAFSLLFAFLLLFPSLLYAQEGDDNLLLFLEAILLEERGENAKALDLLERLEEESPRIGAHLFWNRLLLGKHPQPENSEELRSAFRYYIHQRDLVRLRGLLLLPIEGGEVELDLARAQAQILLGRYQEAEASLKNHADYSYTEEQRAMLLLFFAAELAGKQELAKERLRRLKKMVLYLFPAEGAEAIERSLIRKPGDPYQSERLFEIYLKEGNAKGLLKIMPGAIREGWVYLYPAFGTLAEKGGYAKLMAALKRPEVSARVFVRWLEYLFERKDFAKVVEVAALMEERHPHMQEGRLFRELARKRMSSPSRVP